MSFEMLQALRYIFNYFSLIFIVSAGVYGLAVDIKRLRRNGSEFDREIKIAKRMYISCIAIGIITYTFPRVIGG